MTTATLDRRHFRQKPKKTGSDERLEEELSDALYEIGFRIEQFLSDQFGAEKDDSLSKRFTIDKLQMLSREATEEFEQLVNESIGLRAWWEHFG